MNSVVLVPWRADWLWSVPLIVVTIVFHSYVLGLLSQGLVILLKPDRKKRVTHVLSVCAVGGSSLCAICLHAVEAGMWAVAYHLLGTLGGGGRKDAMLYSTSVMTTVGGTNLHLDPSWALMGPLEAWMDGFCSGLPPRFYLLSSRKSGRWSTHSPDDFSRKCIRG